MSDDNNTSRVCAHPYVVLAVLALGVLLVGGLVVTFLPGITLQGLLERSMAPRGVAVYGNAKNVTVVDTSGGIPRKVEGCDTRKSSSNKCRFEVRLCKRDAEGKTECDDKCRMDDSEGTKECKPTLFDLLTNKPVDKERIIESKTVLEYRIEEGDYTHWCQPGCAGNCCQGGHEIQSSLHKKYKK